jgi:hypothetical protein
MSIKAILSKCFEFIFMHCAVNVKKIKYGSKLTGFCVVLIVLF